MQLLSPDALPFSINRPPAEGSLRCTSPRRSTCRGHRINGCRARSYKGSIARTEQCNALVDQRRHRRCPSPASRARKQYCRLPASTSPPCRTCFCPAQTSTLQCAACPTRWQSIPALSHRQIFDQPSGAASRPWSQTSSCGERGHSLMHRQSGSNLQRRDRRDLRATQVPAKPLQSKHQSNHGPIHECDEADRTAWVRLFSSGERLELAYTPCIGTS